MFVYLATSYDSMVSAENPSECIKKESPPPNRNPLTPTLAIRPPATVMFWSLIVVYTSPHLFPAPIVTDILSLLTSTVVSPERETSTPELVPAHPAFGVCPPPRMANSHLLSAKNFTATETSKGDSGTKTHNGFNFAVEATSQWCSGAVNNNIVYGRWMNKTHTSTFGLQYDSLN
jgi:hypothetical protein